MEFFTRALAVAFLMHSIALAAEPAAPDWAPAMKDVHRNFAGTSGFVAQFGDSITCSMAFWKPMSWGDPDACLMDDGLPKKPEGKRWRDTIKGARDEGKGPAAGN